MPPAFAVIKEYKVEQFFLDLKNQFVLNFINEGRWKHIVRGLGNTMLITLGALAIGVVIGIIVAAVRASFDKNE